MNEMMKRCLSLGFSLSVIFFTGIRRMSTPAQNDGRDDGKFSKPPAPAPLPLPVQSLAPERPMATSFSGTVVRHGSRFALREQDGDLYAIDSTGLAWPFEGEEVLISGYLNHGSGLLHICAIEEVDDLRAEAV